MILTGEMEVECEDEGKHHDMRTGEKKKKLNRGIFYCQYVQ
jgi:hypothetical protein